MLDATTGEACAARRRAVLDRLGDRRVLLPAGNPPSRNFPGSPYPYRASSHFLYLVGVPIKGAVLDLNAGQAALYIPAAEPDEALWHGEQVAPEQLEADLALPVHTLKALPVGDPNTGVAPCPDRRTRRRLMRALGREVDDVNEADEQVMDALVHGRLQHDAHALGELRAAAEVTVASHRLGMQATRPGRHEREVVAAMLAHMTAAGCVPAYGPIVSVHGEVLHNEAHHNRMDAGDLLLVDVGAESPGGWASDVTRTWPVGGRFSPTQRAVYEVVLAAQHAAIDLIAPGVRFRDVHMAAAHALADGLVELALLLGDPEDLVAEDAYALFMPHGIGHLLGLDVHDMEDLGDRAGYPPGKARDTRFGLNHLRLDRTLQPDAGALPREQLAFFSDVRGIRIEDDVLVTEDGHEVLTDALPREPQEIESMVGG
jgi:Xaa-Pro aminopeptidase